MDAPHIFEYVDQDKIIEMYRGKWGIFMEKKNVTNYKDKKTAVNPVYNIINIFSIGREKEKVYKHTENIYIGNIIS